MTTATATKTANKPQGGVDRPGGFPSFCIYGRSGSGKTPQIGIFAQQLFQESGGKVVDGKCVGGLRTRLYTADRGGYDTILSEIELGLIELVDMRGFEKPWVWMAKAIQGRKPLPGETKKWGLKPDLKDAEGNVIGAWAFEGLTEWGEALLADMRDQAGDGVNIGGGAQAIIESKDDEGEDFSYAGNNKAHYLMGQNKMNDMISQSMRLPGYLIWTAIDLRSSEPDSARQVFGPDVGVGKAMTPKIPQKFTYTWRTVNVAKKGEDSRYLLYLVTHQDPIVPAITCLCNARYPKDAPEAMKVQYIEPANVAKAYVAVKQARESAKQAILDRLSN
jgi:hypothetical protein